MALVRPESVVDVGCGVGEWLAAFGEHGVTDVLGIDGHYLDRTQLAIPVERFLVHDLSTPVRVDRSFDLAISLEVGENLHDGDLLVDSLVGLAPVVVFSSAVPQQGGIHHVNEQWQDWWADKFAGRGYVGIDCLRREMLRSADIAWWYSQNTILYVQEARLADYPRLRERLPIDGGRPVAFVHPYLYLEARRALTFGARRERALDRLRLLKKRLTDLLRA
jgi:SAM-dependent methyltransferase